MAPLPSSALGTPTLCSGPSPPLTEHTPSPSSLIDKCLSFHPPSRYHSGQWVRHGAMGRAWENGVLWSWLGSWCLLSPGLQHKPSTPAHPTTFETCAWSSLVCGHIPAWTSGFLAPDGHGDDSVLCPSHLQILPPGRGSASVALSPG